MVASNYVATYFNFVKKHKMKKLPLFLIILSVFYGHQLEASSLKLVLDNRADANNAPAIQSAIDSLSRSGGGKIIIPEGTYALGTVYLKDNIELYLSEGAELLGSLNLTEDYSDRALICAKKAKNIKISGKGTINGNSDSEYYKSQFEADVLKNNDSIRPFGIYLEDCKRIVIKDMNLKNAGFWSLRLFRCDGVDISGISIESLHCVNNDGIDVDAKNVRIRNCNIRTDDDGICLKSNDSNFEVENITVEGCTIASNCNPIKFGTASCSAFKNVTFRNCKVRSTGVSQVWDWSKSYEGINEREPLGLSGITVQSTDGAVVENIRFENIDIDGIMTPFFLYVGRRSGSTGSMKNISFKNINVNARGYLPSLINGHADSKIKNVSFKNVRITSDGYSGSFPAKIRENENGYPENRMFGKTNPAGAVYIRHADGIVFRNFQLNHRSEDVREPFVMEDANNIVFSL